METGEKCRRTEGDGGNRKLDQIRRKEERQREEVGEVDGSEYIFPPQGNYQGCAPPRVTAVPRFYEDFLTTLADFLIQKHPHGGLFMGRKFTFLDMDLEMPQGVALVPLLRTNQELNIALDPGEKM